MIGAGVFASLGLWTALADFVLVGIRRKTPLFLKVCELFDDRAPVGMADGASGPGDSGRVALDLAIVLGLAGPGFAGDRDRGGIPRRVRPPGRGREARAAGTGPGILRALRLQGRDEDALRQFVCVYSGKHWEEFYEALFGYDAKREARERWGRQRAGRIAAQVRLAGAIRSRPGSIAAIAARREAEVTATLWKIEERNLQSLGENLVSARRKARRSAAGHGGHGG